MIVQHHNRAQMELRGAGKGTELQGLQNGMIESGGAKRAGRGTEEVSRA